MREVLFRHVGYVDCSCTKIEGFNITGVHMYILTLLVYFKKLFSFLFLILKTNEFIEFSDNGESLLSTRRHGVQLAANSRL